jgi:hypothetical protein
LRGLATTRAKVRQVKDEIKAAEKAIEDDEKWIALCAARAAGTIVNKENKAVEEALRGVLVTTFRDTKAKGPFFDGAASVMSGNSIKIDRDEFLEWAIVEGRTFITIDEKALLSYAQKNDVPGVKIVKIPKARIAKDLTRFEEKEEEVDGQQS